MRRTLRPVALGTESVLTGASRPAAGQPVAALAVAHAATQLVSCSSFGSAGLLFAEVALLHEKEVAGCGVAPLAAPGHRERDSYRPCGRRCCRAGGCAGRRRDRLARAKDEDVRGRAGSTSICDGPHHYTGNGGRTGAGRWRARGGVA